MPRGRPRKERDANDDGKTHRIWDITDWDLFQGEALNEDRFARWKRLSEPDCTRKLMVAKELSPKTQRLHGQCRVSFNVPHTFDYVRKLFPESHVEVTVATNDWSYFLKFDSSLMLDIDNRRQGQRNIFKDQLEAIKTGSNVRDCMELPGANFQSVRSAELLMKYHEPPHPGTSRTVQYVSKSDDWTWTPDKYVLRSKQYWDGYDAHSTLVINQGVCNFTRSELSQIMSSCPHTVSFGRQARWTNIIIFNCDLDTKYFLRKRGVYVPHQ